MGRSAWRVRLENGLKLDLNRLTRAGFVRPGTISLPTGITRTDSYWGLGGAVFWADMRGPIEGEFQISMGDLDQRIGLVQLQRHFGGGQWYFVCPITNRRASVLWKLPGAARFCSRQACGGRV